MTPLQCTCPTCGEGPGRPCRSPAGKLSPCEHSTRRRVAQSRLSYSPSPEQEAAWAIEQTEAGAQYVMPGCEKPQASAPVQLSLF